MTSLGFLTDIALLKLAGSTVEDRGDHLVVSTPANPSFYWGNFLLLDQVPARDQVAEWLERFETAFPETRHRAFGFDVTDGTVDDVAGFAERGLEVELSTVMTGECCPSAAPSQRRGGLSSVRGRQRLVAERGVEHRLLRLGRFAKPPHVRRTPHDEQPLPRRGRARSVVRRVHG